MPDKRSKYDTDPLDPDFVRRTEDVSGPTSEVGGETRAIPAWPDPAANEPTRRFDEQLGDSYPSVFVPPQYQAPPPPRPQPFTTFGVGAESHPPPATTVPPGPASAYQPAAEIPPSGRKVTKLGLPEHIAAALPYAPFYIGLVFAIIALLVVPRHETRARFHAAQGLALQAAILVGSFIFQVVGVIAGAGLGRFLFSFASFIFLIVSMVRVWQGKPHHIAPLDDATALHNDKIKPMQNQ